MKKVERVKTAEKICDIYSTGKYTIESCCEANGVKYNNFYHWITKGRVGYTQEIQEYYKKAKEDKRANHTKKLVDLSLTALERKLMFGQITEIRIEKDEEGNIIKTIEITKHLIPTATDLALVLNLFFDETGDRRQIEVLEFL